LAIVRLHVEGWNAKSIAAYLETSRQTVHATLKRWSEEEFAGCRTSCGRHIDPRPR